MLPVGWAAPSSLLDFRYARWLAAGSSCLARLVDHDLRVRASLGAEAGPTPGSRLAVADDEAA